MSLTHHTNIKLSSKRTPLRVRRNRMRRGCPPLFLMSLTRNNRKRGERGREEAMTEQKVGPPPRLPCPIWHPTREQCPALSEKLKERSQRRLSGNCHLGSTREGATLASSCVEHLQSLVDCPHQRLPMPPMMLAHQTEREGLLRSCGKQ